MLSKHSLTLIVLGFVIATCRFVHAQSMTPRLYDPGAPGYQDLWVDPINGSDDNNGDSRVTAFRTLIAAWERLPFQQSFTTAYRIQIAPGSLSEEQIPHYLESRYGTEAFPLLIQAADGPGTVQLDTGLNVFDCRYFYLKDLSIGNPQTGGDVLHYELCNYIYVSNCLLIANRAIAQETVKLNQCQYVYFEGNDISGANDNGVDCVGVQYGHFVDNIIHNTEDWGMYLKGGSAYIRVEGNEYYDSGTGGFTAGQGTGFEFMVSPWLQYEAYDIKFINNLIHDVEGAAMGVQGGYNILLAHNTAYRIGTRSHILEVVAGLRSCDGNAERCGAYNGAGGWGPSAPGEEDQVPNRNVYIYNNIFYNPSGTQSQWQQFAIFGPTTAPTSSNIPNPVNFDTNLRIRGNIIWNGPLDHPLGLGEETGCQANNPTCSETQLLSDNSINRVEPQFIDAAHGDFRPLADGNLYSATTYEIPDFNGGDRPAIPATPSGNLANLVARDFNNHARNALFPGAIASQEGSGGSGGEPGGEDPGNSSRYKLYLPHYTFLNGSWSTELTLSNPTATAQTARITAYDNSGVSAGSFQVSLPAHGGWSQTLETLNPSLSSSTGWLTIGTDDLGVSGILKFSFLATKGTSSLPIVRGGGTRLLLPLLENNSLFFSGLALVNLATSPATVNIQLSSLDGTVQLQHERSLAAGQKIVSLLSDIFGPNLPEKMSVLIQSTASVTGFALSFSTGIQQIVAVPAEILQ